MTQGPSATAISDATEPTEYVRYRIKETTSSRITPGGVFRNDEKNIIYHIDLLSPDGRTDPFIWV